MRQALASQAPSSLARMVLSVPLVAAAAALALGRMVKSPAV
jgi:hypothetical protein